jgi:transposase, IS5 family
MRKSFDSQLPITESWLDLEPAKELKTISMILDQDPRVLELVLQDLLAQDPSSMHATGAQGLSAEQVLRALLIKQINQFSYRQLAFHLADSRSYRTFCRLGWLDPGPSKSSLAAAIKAIQPSTLEQINRILVQTAQELKIESGHKVRVDCTVVESNIHHPTDSGLLWDCVRKLTDLMIQARKVAGAQQITFHNRTRRAKRRHKEITHAKSKQKRLEPYRDLIWVTQEVRGRAQWIYDLLEDLEDQNSVQGLCFQSLRARLCHFLTLTDRVVEQTSRRVLGDETVPATEKVVSIFEEHTDIIRKDNRDTYYGHKICLAAGRSSMILDCVVLSGNPADSTLAETMVERQEQLYQRRPRQVVFDGGFCSRSNWKAIRSKGIRDVAFSRGRGLKVHEMAKSAWVYQQLRNFRAGVEGVISFLKRVFGLDRCRWKSLRSFHSYVWSSIVSCNLLLLARHKLASG